MKRPEDILQKAVCAFIDVAAPGLLYFAVPNGGGRSKVEGAILKATGVKAGVPDIVILLPNAGAGFLELKAGKGVLSPTQKQWRDDLRARGYAWAEVRSVEEVEDILGRWLLPFGWTLKASVKPRKSITPLEAA